MAVAAGDSSLAGAIQVLAERGAARALPIGEDEWWFDVDTPRDHRNGSRHVLRVTGKPLDGAIAARLNRTLSQRVVTPALLALFTRITPNQVTLIAFAVAVAAAAGFAVGAPIAAALLVALASVLDGSDGEVARLTYRSSPYGAFLDAVLDRAADGILFTGAAIYLATDTHLGDLLGGAQVPLALSVSGAALVGHLLVSYTTAKAAIDLGHRYRGTLLGGGRGRDLRLFLVTLGALAAAVEPVALLVALAAVALLSAWMVVVRLHRSWWAAGPGSQYAGVRVVALDFDGTVADSMGFLTDLAVGLLVDELGFERAEAARQYLATAGSEFGTQLDELAPGQPGLAEVASRFEAEKTRWMVGCEMFTDVVPAVERLAAAASRSCCAAARGRRSSASFASGTGCSRGSPRSTVGARATPSRCSLCRGSPPPASPVTRSSSSATPDATPTSPAPQARGSSAWSVQDAPTPSPAAAPRSWPRCPSWPPTSSKPSAPR
jgi:phosphatidylglycerophosphate synthase